MWDNVYRVIGFIKIPCNWLQCMENTPDPVHTEYLHGHYFKHWMARNGVTDARMQKLADGFATHFIKHDYAIGKYGIDRRWLLEGQTGGQRHLGRRAAARVPRHPLHVGQRAPHFGWRMPIDDVTRWKSSCAASIPARASRSRSKIRCPTSKSRWSTRQGRFTALDAITGQDVMAWVSQGPIIDRTKERLADTDRGIILYRKLLFEQVARVEAGLDPINVVPRSRREPVHRSAGAVGPRVCVGLRQGRQLRPRLGDRRRPAPAAPQSRDRRHSSSRPPPSASASLPARPDRKVSSFRNERTFNDHADRQGSPGRDAVRTEAPRCSIKAARWTCSRDRALVRAHQSLRRGRRERDPRAHRRRASVRDPRRRGDLPSRPGRAACSVLRKHEGIIIPAGSYYWFVSQRRGESGAAARRREGRGLERASTTASTSRVSRSRATRSKTRKSRSSSTARRVFLVDRTMADASQPLPPRERGGALPEVRVRPLGSCAACSRSSAAAALWEIAGRTFLNNPLFFAPLSAVLARMGSLWQTGDLQTDIVVELRRVHHRLRAGDGRRHRHRRADGELEADLRGPRSVGLDALRDAVRRGRAAADAVAGHRPDRAHRGRLHRRRLPGADQHLCGLWPTAIATSSKSRDRSAPSQLQIFAKIRFPGRAAVHRRRLAARRRARARRRRRRRAVRLAGRARLSDPDLRTAVRSRRAVRRHPALRARRHRAVERSLRRTADGAVALPGDRR